MIEEKASLLLDANNPNQSSLIFNALSSASRISIMKELTRRVMTVSEIAEFFYMSVSSASFHVKMLNDAGLITVQSHPGKRGYKLCGIRVSQVMIDFFKNDTEVLTKPEVTDNIPIGCYAGVSVKKPCGLASGEHYLFQEDNPYGFYSSSHTQAGILWFSSGYVSYRVSNEHLQTKDTRSIEISFEACSEAPGYDNDWPSDITLSVNDTVVAEHTVEGDFGDVRGRLNPTWWADSLSQYGELIKLVITESECLLNGKTVSSHSLNSLGMRAGYSFDFKIGVRESAKNMGGINLFGHSFGNYPQDIFIRISYR